MTLISGWGGFPIADTDLGVPQTTAAVCAAMAAADGSIARGNGRAYGDAAIGENATVAMKAFDRVRGFDAEMGHVTVEAGVLLADLIATFLPRGFFPMVVPGTRFVTVGGAIAADVHGKNHHRDGGFGDHVLSFVLATPDHGLMRVSRDEHAELFQATVGGMGLTGTIVEATLRLRPVETGWVEQRTIVAPDLAAAIAALDAGDAATYSVAWIDCLARGRHLGRSLVYLGEHASRDRLDAKVAANPFPPVRDPRRSVPVDLPPFALNRLSVSAFNELYFRLGARRAGDPFLVQADPYFFPLDGLANWNRIYGRYGFVQHQCVLPTDRGPDVLAKIMECVSARGDASFLAVLKKLGPGNGLMSFPMPGYTLALDFQVSPDLLAFLDVLDRLVVKAGGRLYLAKDARQSRKTFAAGYPNLDRFREIRRSVDSMGRLRSRLAERLGI